jgi:benzoyl-CoA-dihydrodiol lyase
LKGKRAKDWKPIDGTFPTSKFQEAIDERVREVTQTVSLRKPASPDEANEQSAQTNSLHYEGVRLNPLKVNSTDNSREYKYVSLQFHRDKRYVDLTMRGPEADLPNSPDEIHKLGDAFWPLQAYRELDDALLHLRVNEPEIGLVCVRTEGNLDNVLAVTESSRPIATIG